MHKVKMERRDYSFKVYVTDILKAAAERKSIGKRWVDLERPVKQFDPNSVVESVIERGGLAVKE